MELKGLYRLRFIGERYSEKLKPLDSKSLNLPSDLDRLNSSINECFLCELSKSRNRSILGGGNRESSIFFVSDLPGVREDESGCPLSGRVGAKFDEIIWKMLGFRRDEIYISQLLRCKPPQNRNPQSSEMITCRSYLLKEIELVDPKVIVTLGALAYRYLNDDTTELSKIHGDIFEFNSRYLIPTLSPADIIKNPSKKKDIYYDFLKIKSFLEKNSINN